MKGLRLRPPIPWLACATAALLCTAASAQGQSVSVASVAIASSPVVGDTYGPGETIRVEVTFSGPVDVAPGPRPYVTLEVGASSPNEKYAFHEDGSGTNKLGFEWRVTTEARDSNGVTIRQSDAAGTTGLRRGDIYKAGNDPVRQPRLRPAGPPRRPQGRRRAGRGHPGPLRRGHLGPGGQGVLPRRGHHRGGGQVQRDGPGEVRLFRPRAAPHAAGRDRNENHGQSSAGRRDRNRRVRQDDDDVRVRGSGNRRGRGRRFDPHERTRHRRYKPLTPCRRSVLCGTRRVRGLLRRDFETRCRGLECRSQGPWPFLRRVRGDCRRPGSRWRVPGRGGRPGGGDVRRAGGRGHRWGAALRDSRGGHLPQREVRHLRRRLGHGRAGLRVAGHRRRRGRQRAHHPEKRHRRDHRPPQGQYLPGGNEPARQPRLCPAAQPRRPQGQRHAVGPRPRSVPSWSSRPGGARGTTASGRPSRRW